MEYIGLSVSPKLQTKALAAVHKFVDLQRKQHSRKLYRFASKSWKGYWWKRKHTIDFINTLLFDDYEVKYISFRSEVMFFAKIEFYLDGTIQMRSVSFISERRPYKTSVKANFRYNPISFTGLNRF